MTTTTNAETPIVTVEVSHDGMEVIPSVRDTRLKVHYGLLSRRVERVGPIKFKYSWLTGSVKQIGSAVIHYSLISNEIKSVGHDPRVQIFVRARPRHPREDV